MADRRAPRDRRARPFDRGRAEGRPAFAREGARGDDGTEGGSPSLAPPEGRLVYGIQPVREAVRVHGRAVTALWFEVAAGPKVGALARFAADRGVVTHAARRDELDRRAGHGRHQGVVAAAPPLPIVDLGAVALSDAATILALDGIMDPQNFGAIVRSAVALGAAAVVWPEHASAPLSPATFRASAGAIEHATLCRVPSLPGALASLAERGVTAVALDAHGDVELSDLELDGPVAVVVGAEDRGARRAVRQACRYAARLWMPGPIDSLNASVAAALALYVVGRRRRREAAPASS